MQIYNKQKAKQYIHNHIYKICTFDLNRFVKLTIKFKAMDAYKLVKFNSDSNLIILSKLLSFLTSNCQKIIIG